jgi:hypothetical protein
MTPRLFRRLEICDAKQGTDHILQHMPADCYTYGHGSWAEQVQALYDTHGRTVYWYVNLFHISDQWDTEWTDYFPHQWAQHCRQNDLWLRYKQDQSLARFPWFGNPRLVNMAKITRGQADSLVGLIDRPGPYMIDQVWAQVFDWMLHQEGPEKPCVGDLADYSGTGYLLGVKRFLGACMDHPDTFLNGWDNWDEAGYKVMYENADVGSNLARLGWTVARWQANPGSILSIERDFSVPDTMAILKLWRRAGGILECINPVVAQVAWEMKQ